MVPSQTARVRRYQSHPWQFTPPTLEPSQSREPPPCDWALDPWQVLPNDGGWDTFVFLGGRGTGKTFTGARAVLDHLRAEGRRARVLAAAPTLVDVRDVCAEGETGLITIAPDEFPTYHRSIGYCEARHVGGGYVRFMGAEEPKRFNGPQWSMGWWDEWPLCNLDSYQQYQFGLRLGAWPRTVITATPKAIAKVELEALLAREGVVARVGIRTDDNVHLSARRRAELQRDFGGTTLALSELEGRLVFDTEGALWRYEWIERARVLKAPELARVVVAIDPAGGLGNQSAQTGIAAGGRGVDGDYYVTALEGVQLSPLEWFRRGCALYDNLKADALVVEQNYGGPFIVEMAKEHRPDVNVVMVAATRGKTVRAEPIAALYQQGRVHHVGLHADGEAQMCAFPLTKRKDMTDAAVWLVSHLVEHTPVGGFADMPGYGAPVGGGFGFRRL